MVGGADDGAFGDVGVGGEDLFHAAGGQAVAGDVDDVVDARHDEQVAVFVLHPCVAGEVVAGLGAQIRIDEAVVVLPQGGQAAGGHGQLDHDAADLARVLYVAVVVEDAHVIARHGLGRGAGLDRQGLDAHEVGGDAPAGFGLPPVVDDRALEDVLGPGEGVGVAALAGQEQGAVAGHVVLLEELGLGVDALDGAQGGGGGEHDRNPVLADHAPEGAGVGGADGLAFVDDGGAAVEQGGVDDVGVAHHPADVGGGPEDLAGLHGVEVLHAPGHGDGVATVVAHHALGDAGGAGGVEDVEGVGGGDRDAGLGLGAGYGRLPVDVAAFDHGPGFLGAAQDDAVVGLVLGHVDGLVEEGLVVHHPAGLDAAGAGDHDLGLGVVDASRQLAGGEAAEDHRVDGTDAGAGEHGDGGLGDHGHVDDDPVALGHPQAGEDAGEAADQVLELGVTDLALRLGDGAVVDDGDLVAAAGLDVAVDGVIAGIQHAAGEPAVEGGPGVIQDLVPGLVPVDGLGGLGPETLGIGQGTLVNLVVAHDRLSS